MFARPLSSFLVLLALALSLAAQTKGVSETVQPPFPIGETLTYEGKISRIISGISVAELTLTVGQTPNPGNYLIKAEARSKGTLLKLFRFSFLQQLDSTIDRDRFRAVRTVKNDVQKERVRTSEAVFDYGERRVTYVETDPKEPARPPRRIASTIEEHTHDLISGIYALRMLPLGVGKRFDFTVSDSGLVYEVPVRVTAREKQKTIFGNIWCYRLEPEVFGTGRMIEREGKMTIWIADNAQRIPVRSRIDTEFGRIEVRLKSVGGTAQITKK